MIIQKLEDTRAGTHLSNKKIDMNMKALFNKKKKLARQLKEVGHLLDLEINKKWGFHYSETDDDQIIDTLDYGICGISFDTFIRKMDEYKENLENDEDFGLVF